jgi:hypothetical protein
MGYDWERHREEITDLYGSGNYTLAEIRGIFAAKVPPFNPRSAHIVVHDIDLFLTASSVSAYRDRLRTWKCRKFPQNHSENQCAASSTTTSSFVRSPSRHVTTPQRASRLGRGPPVNNFKSNRTLSRRQSPPCDVPESTLHPSGNGTISLASQLPSSSRPQPYQLLDPSYHSDSSEESLPSQGSNSCSPSGNGSAELDAGKINIPYSGLQSHQSPFPNIATDLFGNATINQGVGGVHSTWNPPGSANKSHSSEATSFTYLPTPESLKTSSYPTPVSSSSVPIPDLADRVNTHLDSLAAGTPAFNSLDGLKNFQLRNTNGETFLHVLDPNFSLPDSLLSYKRKGFDFMQRTNSGVTAIQALLEKISDPSVGCSVLPVLPRLGVNPYARDRLNKSARDSIDRWQHQINKTSFDKLRQRFASDKREILPAVEFGYGSQDVQQRLAADVAMSKVVERSLFNAQSEDENGRTALICLMLMVRPRSESQCNMLCLPSQNRELLVEECIARGVDVNAYDKDGFTALHYWLSTPRVYDEEHSASILRLLLGGGANVHLRDRRGDTALHLACVSGLRECTRLLIEHIHNNKSSSYIAHAPGVNAKNDRGRSVVAEASWWLRNADLEDERDRIQRCISLVIDAGGSRT